MGYVRAVAFCFLTVGCGFDATSNNGAAGSGGSGSDGGSGAVSVDAPLPPKMCGDLSCDPRAECHEASGNTPASCTCPTGFLDENADGSACSDIDECAVTPSPCDAQGKSTCENTPGSYECYTPAKCQDAKDHHQPDGETTIYAGGDITKPWKAICDGGKDYLELAKPQNNYAIYARSSFGDTDVKTTYTGVKIDPASFVVDIKDLAHASSSGSAFAYGRRVTSMMWGTAMDCSNDAKADGTASIDLTGTAFKLADAAQWVLEGDAGHVGTGHSPARDAPSGAATATPDGRTVALTGGGDCGWIAPKPGVTLPFSGQSNNTQLIQLVYVAPPIQ